VSSNNAHQISQNATAILSAKGDSHETAEIVALALVRSANGGLHKGALAVI